MTILFVFESLSADDTAATGGAAADVAMLAGALDPARYRIEVVVCAREKGLPDQAHALFGGIGVPVDRLPYHISPDETVAYLASILPGYDAVVACQGGALLHTALEGLHLRPPLIEHDSTPRTAARWQALFDAMRRVAAPPPPPLFNSVVQGGFECSTHRRAHDRRRIDVIAATGHDAQAAGDYRALQRHGIRTVRDGLRWHLIEREAGYDWSSLENQLAAAQETGTQVIWDLLHYGWPDDVDVWSPAFAPRFAAFAAAAARVIGARTAGTRFYCPINEISFLSWGGGDVGYLNPFTHGRGFELKVQLARAAIAAMEGIRAIDPAARFVHVDPLINVITDPARPGDAPAAEGQRQAQFQGWDLIAGRIWPQIGGRADLLDIVGVNYYHNNQWIHGGPPVDRTHPLYRPLHRMIAETYARYGRPIFIAETGIEGDARAEWLAYIMGEVAAARALGVPVAGVCLYPILNHPGWDDDRPCPNGLLDDARQADPAFAAELARHLPIG